MLPFTFADFSWWGLTSLSQTHSQHASRLATKGCVRCLVRGVARRALGAGINSFETCRRLQEIRLNNARYVAQYYTIWLELIELKHAMWLFLYCVQHVFLFLPHSVHPPLPESEILL
ncbi:hypothetical protein LZ32DRAFT_59599 [Colletotrichum eremochloae]|nr:hypothetical protein LZ32DRAFT_59599 [Colletotrichum eremochloae]